MYIAIISILLIIFIVLIYIGNYFSDTVCKPTSVDYNKSFELVVAGDRLDKNYVDSLLKNEFFIDSRFGYKLHGYKVENDKSKFIVFCHGYSWNLTGDFKYTKMFLDKGYSIIMYDHRNHGLSGGCDTSFGYYEKFDLQTIIQMLRTEYGEDIEIGLHGESLGAAVAMEYLRIDNNIKFCIEDCGFMDTKELFNYRVEEDYKIHFKALVYIASVITKFKRGWFFKDASPIKSIKHTTVPILFIHGEEDKYIRTNSAIKLHKSYKGIKKLYIAKGAEHAMSYSVNPELYKQIVYGFIDNI